MQTVFTSRLKPLLDAIAAKMELYIPDKIESHYIFRIYNPENTDEVELNNIRACTPVKEFLFPLRELAAIYPDPVELKDIKPFAVFGLKDCDLRSIEILDKVFKEDEFEDFFYIKRRENMFIISSDCFEPAQSCICNMLSGKPFSESGYDLNVSKVSNGFIVESGSEKGEQFITNNSGIFTEAGQDAIQERNANRRNAQKQLEKQNTEYNLDVPVHEIVQASYESSVYDQEAATCVECQACTRVCPTCHCFYLYDTKQKEYFGKMKMWDSCMRLSYALVAGGENPRKVLGNRLRHRFMHKFLYFLERYGIDMCVGCGRCIDAEAGQVDLRKVLKKLNDELNVKVK